MPKIIDYAPIVGEESISELFSLSEEIQGKVVQEHQFHLRERGGVAEILSRIVPLLRQLGIDATWDILKGDEPFFRITKKIHNALQ